MDNLVKSVGILQIYKVCYLLANQAFVIIGLYKNANLSQAKYHSSNLKQKMIVALDSS